MEHLFNNGHGTPIVIKTMGIWWLGWRLGRLWRGPPNKIILYWKAKQDFIQKLKDSLQKLNKISYPGWKFPHKKMDKISYETYIRFIKKKT